MSLSPFWSVPCYSVQRWSLRAPPCLSRNTGATLVRTAMDSHAHLSGHCHCPPQASWHPGLNCFHNSPLDIFSWITTHVVSSGSFQRKYEYLQSHLLVDMQKGIPSILVPRISVYAFRAEKHFGSTVKIGEARAVWVDISLLTFSLCSEPLYLLSGH